MVQIQIIPKRKKCKNYGLKVKTKDSKQNYFKALLFFKFVTNLPYDKAVAC